MDVRRVQQIREDMERAEARRLQPHFIAAFFREAFGLLGGTLQEREPKRYEITHVPAVVRNRDRQIGIGQPVLTKYERDHLREGPDQRPRQAAGRLRLSRPPAARRHHRPHRWSGTATSSSAGAVLVDPTDHGEDIRALFYLEHSIQDARNTRSGERRVVSRQLQFVEIDATDQTRMAGYAPYLDYRPITDEERASVQTALEADWLTTDLESKVQSFAIQSLVPGHLQEVRSRNEERDRPRPSRPSRTA